MKFAGSKANDASRLMLARGLVPLPPDALLTGIYHLWANTEWEASPVAEKTLSGLPTATLLGALGKRGLPPGVVDLIARKFGRNSEVLEKVTLHPEVDDETLVGLSRRCPAVICELLANNQERWMRCPEIIVGLYNNPDCKMSVVHRALEFARRNDIDIRLPMMEEIKVAMDETDGPDPERDAAFQARVSSAVNALASDDGGSEGVSGQSVEITEDAEVDLSSTDVNESEASEAETEAEVEEQSFASRTQELMAMNTMEKIRAALLGDQSDRGFLIKDSNKIVAMAVIKSPKVKENEVVGYSSNRSLSPDVIRYIASRREWVKLYQVKLNLVMNPKTPMARAMSFLPFLKNNDVKKLARSKNIPAALAKAAKRKVQGQR